MCEASVWQVCGTNTTWFCCCEDEAQVERTSRCNANYEQFHVCEFVQVNVRVPSAKCEYISKLLLHVNRKEATYLKYLPQKYFV